MRKRRRVENSPLMCRHRAEQCNSFHCLLLYIRGKNPFFVFVASTNSTLTLWQGWDLCRFYVSAKFNQSNSPRGLTGEIITKKPHKTLSHCSEPEYQKTHPQKPSLSLNLSQAWVLVPHLYRKSKLRSTTFSACTWSLNSNVFSRQNCFLKLNVNKLGQQLIIFLN